MARQELQAEKMPVAFFPCRKSLPKRRSRKATFDWWRDIRTASASKAELIGTPGGTRTPHLLLRRQLLYPDELLARMERVMGIEPTPTAWKAVVLAVILHPHLEFSISHKIVT